MNESICGDSCPFVKLKALIKPPTHTPTPFIKKSNWKYLWHINMFGLQLWALHISCSVGKFHTASNMQVNLHHFNELTDYSSSIGTYLISHQRPSQRAAVSGFWWHLDTNCCTWLWNLFLFTPVMCVNTTDRLPAAVNTECHYPGKTWVSEGTFVE